MKKLNKIIKNIFKRKNITIIFLLLMIIIIIILLYFQFDYENAA